MSVYIRPLVHICRLALRRAYADIRLHMLTLWLPIAAHADFTRKRMYIGTGTIFGTFGVPYARVACSNRDRRLKALAPLFCAISRAYHSIVDYFGLGILSG